MANFGTRADSYADFLRFAALSFYRDDERGKALGTDGAFVEAKTGGSMLALCRVCRAQKSHRERRGSLDSTLERSSQSAARFVEGISRHDHRRCRAWFC